MTRASSVSVYIAVTIIGTALFFLLHHLGNRIPYDLTQQRFAAEFRSGQPDEGRVAGFKGSFEYCQISLAVMGGARGTGELSVAVSFVDAVLLRILERISPDYCAGLKAASEGAELDANLLKTRYWWGGKALYALALRQFSVFEIREATRWLTYFAYALLAIILLRFAPRVLLVASPLIAFGAFFSGVKYFADVANGMPYLWTVLSASVLALLMYVRASRGAVRLFCFITGMVSSYLWMFDGHTILAVTLIGLLAWFRSGLPGELETSAKLRSAVSCIALYLAGFVVCFALGQLIKLAVYEWAINSPGLWSQHLGAGNEARSGRVIDIFVKAVLKHTHRGSDVFFTGMAGMMGASSWEQWPVVRYLGNFWAAGVGSFSAGKVLTVLSGVALVFGVSSAAFQSRRGHPSPLRDVLFIAWLILIACLQLLLPNDIPYRIGRFLFVPHALCWSCLVLAVMSQWRHERI